VSKVERFNESGRQPGEPEWRSLCATAEQLIDTDPAGYETHWLPAVQTQLAEWPTGLRRCPDRWFRTPRPRAELLLSLGAAGPADFADQPPLPGDGPPGTPQSVSAVTAPGSWTVFTTTGAWEFAVPGDDRPDHTAMQVAAFVLDNWTELKGTAERILADLATRRGPRDPYRENGRVPPGRPRFEASGMVSIEASPVRFQLHCDDHTHGTNGWPYGDWRVDFAWARPVDVRVGPYGSNHCALRSAEDRRLL
jgi:hypothetical protein